MRDDGPEDTPARIESTASPVTALALAPNGSLVAVGGLDKLVRAWPLGGAGAALQQVAQHDAPVLSLAWSPNSEYLISGGEDARALLRRNQDGRLEADAEHASFPHERQIQGLAFSPDQRWLATGSDDGMIRVWNLEQGKVKQRDLTGHEGPILALAFDATSEVLVSASQDKTLRLWRVDDLDIGGDVSSVVLRGHSGPITALRLDPAGRFAISGGEDGAVHVWPLQHELLLRLACRVVGRDLTEEEWGELFPGEAIVPVCERR
jgi:WD40 repeat protein